MADPGTMALVGMGTNVAGNLLGIGKAKASADATRLNIQGQMMKAMGEAFGMEVQAQQYTYEANKNKYQAAVAKMNEEISEGNAHYSLEEGEVEAQQAGMKSRAELGEMIASQGASGIDVHVGSAAQVRESMIDIGDYTQRIIRSSAAKKAYGYEIEATQYKAQGDIYRYTATQNEAQAAESLKGANMIRSTATSQASAGMDLAGKAEGINIMGSLVGAAGSVADKWTSATSSGLGKSMMSMFG